MSYVPLNCKTHFSILQAYQKPVDLARRIKELGIESCGVAEYNHLCSCVQIIKNVPSALIGVDTGDFLVYAKNIEGWYEIIQFNNGVKNLEDLRNVVIIYSKPTDNALPGSFWGIDLNTNGAEMRTLDGPKVAIPTILAATKQDQEDYTVVLCLKENDSLENIVSKYKDFLSKKWYIRTDEELRGEGYTEEELENTLTVASMCQDIILPSGLQIPLFDCPEGLTGEQYLRKLCQEGLERLNLTEQKYLDRIESEFAVISKYKLEDYFLVVRDIVMYINNTFGLSGVRGSAAGCLISYLIGITKTDPLKYHLFFERFLNEGRFTSTRIQPPDIDIDVPSDARSQTIDWIRNKYGWDKTGQIMTYPTIKSPAALKAVFRVKNTMSFDQINKITKLLPADHKISDKMKDSGDTSVIMWCLKHKPDLLTEWVRLNEQGEIDGDYKEEFEQAVRLEGTYSARSKHAGGIIVSNNKLTETCPLVWDDELQSYMCGLDMYDLEFIGLPKIDLLGVRVLDKILAIKQRVEKCTLAT